MNIILNTMLQTLKSLLLSTTSIFLGAFFFTTLLSAVFSLQDGVQENASQTLGGDVSISLNQPFSDEEIQKFQNIKEANNAKITFSDTFSGMIISQNSETLTSISVIDGNYPLYGEVEMHVGEYTFPNESQILLDKNFAVEQNLKLDDTVQLGQGEYVISGFFDSLPDGSLFSFFGGKGVISPEGLANSQIELAQNRSTTTARFASIQNAEQIFTDLKNTFPDKKYRITNAEGGGSVGQIFAEVQKISISLIAAITLLFSTSFFMGVYFYIQKESRTIAVLKSLGMQRWDIIKKYTLGVGILWTIVGLFGLGLGAAVLYFFGPWITQQIGSSITLINTGLLSGIGLVFLLPSAALLIMIRQFFSLSPALLLKGNDTSESGNTGKTKAINWKNWGFYFLILLPFAFLLGFIAKSIFFPVYFFLGLGLIFFLLSAVLWGVFFLIRKIKFSLPSFFLRTLTSFVTERGQKKFFILSGFFALFFIVSTVSLVQKSFLENLQTLSGEDAPSAFFLDITKDQKDDFQNSFGPEEDVSVFPILRAKITNLAGKEITDEDSRDLSKAFNINFSDTLSSTTTLIQGKEWEDRIDTNIVSVESEFAEENGIQVNDEIVFDVLGRDIVFTVTGIRELTQRDFNPWFMFTFPENTLKSAPKSFIGFWWASNEEIVQTQKSKIIRSFPNVSVIETSEIKETLAEVSGLLEQSIFWISLLLIFSSALTVLSFVTQIRKGRESSQKMMERIGVDESFIDRLLLGEISMTLILPFGLSLFFAAVVVWGLGMFFFDFTGITLSVLPFILFAGVFVVSVVWWWIGKR